MDPVHVTQHGAVALIVIDNPPVNALSQAVREGLWKAIEKADTDRKTRAIVIACSGRTFFAGADIQEFNQPPREPHLDALVSRIEACSKLVIAAIHGTALGGGLEVAMGCHFRIATADAAVGLPEVNLGLLPGATGSQRLPRLAGIEHALDMMISGQPINAPLAKEYGILDQIADADDVQQEAVAWADELVARATTPRRVRELEVEAPAPGFLSAYRETIAQKSKGLLAPDCIIQCVESSIRLPFDEAAARERELFLKCKASPQSAALRHAFFAERAVSKVPGLSKQVQPRAVEKVGVIGAGTMGAGIAYACATAGLAVVLLDNDDESLGRGQATIRGLFERGVQRGKTRGAEMRASLQRLSTSRSYEALSDVDLVIEAVYENMATKKEVFGRLDEVCRPGAILATNTSTLDVDEIASATARPEDVIGLHFFSPAHVMRLLEIVRGTRTSDEVIATSLALAKRLQKIGVVVGNCNGFVGNRMLHAYGRENQLLLLEGAAPEFIDGVLREWGMAMGPNAVGDLAGLDVGYKARRERSDLPDDPRYYRIADLLVEMGRLGQKTGRGIYRYEPGSRTPIPDPEVPRIIAEEAKRLGIEPRKVSPQEIIERCIYALVIEGARILEERIASRPGDIDVIWLNGYGFPRYRGGPMYYADSVGLWKVHGSIRNFCDRFGRGYWEPPSLLAKLANEGRGFYEVNA